MPRRRPLPTLDLNKLNTHSLYERPSKVEVGHLGRPAKPGCTIDDLFDTLPDQLAANSLRNWRDSVLTSIANDRPVIVAHGGHVIKTGCAPYLIDWIQRGVLTGVCINGSAAIHDLELALAGFTSESVETRLPEGTFGMTRETAEFYANAAERAIRDNIGLGAALGKGLLEADCKRPEASLLRAAAEADIPLTVHVAMGTDIVHMHACCSGEKLGEATMRDFRTLCSMVADLKGGVWMNLGSAVVMPEVFLKAVSIARNMSYDLTGMTTVDLDMIRQYRGRVNVLERHRANGIAITGHHEIMIPLIHAAVVSRL